MLEGAMAKVDRRQIACSEVLSQLQRGYSRSSGEDPGRFYIVSPQQMAVPAQLTHSSAGNEGNGQRRRI